MIDKEQYKTFSLFIPLDYSLESLILKDKARINLFFEMFTIGTNLELIYRGSRDTFKAAVYHEKLDN